jgi:hypothetical protein
MDPEAYTSLPSVPPPTIISISPVPRTIRTDVNVEPRTSRNWLGYCIVILLIFMFSAVVFYYMIYGNRKN